MHLSQLIFFLFIAGDTRFKGYQWALYVNKHSLEYSAPPDDQFMY